MEANQLSATIEVEKRKLLARKELYEHLQKFQDAALVLKGQALNAASSKGANFEDLWKWCLDQLS